MTLVTLLGATAVAGALGALLRDAVVRRGGPSGSAGLAGAVAVVNLGGALLLAGIQVLPVAEPLRFVIGVGFCGSLTTFSTWVVEAVARVEAGAPLWRVAVLDLGAQLTVGVLLVVTVLRLA